MTVVQRQLSGEKLVLDPALRLGSGGEANVYSLPAEPALVAKLYHKPTEERAQKLAVMLANPPEDPGRTPQHTSIAWPTDLLHLPGSASQVVGFVMPRVTGMRPVFDFYNPLNRRQQCPFFNYRYLHHAARNLASAIHALHARNYVVGDLNESNILLSPTALATFVDTDSFQVRDPKTGVLYRCTVGKPEFTPPELQGRNFADRDRIIPHDLFGLAVLIFRMLMEGTHPFDGKYLGAGEQPDQSDRIAAGHFPYGTRKVPYAPKPGAPPFSILHPEIQRLFLRCFEEGDSNQMARPTAREWYNTLEIAGKSLVVCGVNRQHIYGSHLTACPWCERKRLMNGVDPFPSKQEAQAAKKGDTDSGPASVKSTRPMTPPVVPPLPKIISPSAPQPALLSPHSAPPNPLALHQRCINPKDGAEMLWIPPGEFLMGSDEQTEERPPRKVMLDGYWIYKFPVTVAQYRTFSQNTGRKMPTAPAWGWKDSHPMLNLSWADAVAYCTWAGVRLPTEAQWEKAARGTDGRKYPWGNDWNPDYCRCSRTTRGDAVSTSPVGSYPTGASPYGVLDMAGNVWEWCSDWYDTNYYKNAPNRNPTGPTSGTYRSLRGGSWYNTHPKNFRAPDRFWFLPTDWTYNVGFRGLSIP